MSYFEWFIHALGFWWCLALVVGFSVFAGSCCELLRGTRIRWWGWHGALLLLPIVASLIGAIDQSVATYEIVRLLPQLTGSQIAREFILIFAYAIGWGLFVTAPACCVLLIGRLVWGGPRSSPNS